MADKGQGGSSVERVIEHVERLVFEEYQPGESLPSEGDIAEQLQVSRLTVREGMREIAARGLIEISNGRRPVVATLNGRGVGSFFRAAMRRDKRAVLDLLEVRHALEVQIASLAAQNATRSQIAQMEATVEAMAKTLDVPVEFSKEDLRFHELLAAATGNRMMALLIEELAESLSESRSLSTEGHARRGLTLEPVMQQHNKILEAIRDHDQRAARAAMRKHLRDTQADLKAAELP